jgi:hypothetical protein
VLDPDEALKLPIAAAVHRGRNVPRALLDVLDAKP